jgi:hypothetical protein
MPCSALDGLRSPFVFRRNGGASGALQAAISGPSSLRLGPVSNGQVYAGRERQPTSFERHGGAGVLEAALLSVYPATLLLLVNLSALKGNQRAPRIAAGAPGRPETACPMFGGRRTVVHPPSDMMCMCFVHKNDGPSCSDLNCECRHGGIIEGSLHCSYNCTRMTSDWGERTHNRKSFSGMGVEHSLPEGALF